MTQTPPRILAGLALSGLLIVSGVVATPSRAHDHDKVHRQDKVPDRDQALARSALRRGAVQPLRKMLDAAIARVPGEVVKVELEIERGRIVYEIKILATNGMLRKARFDAQSGALIGIEDDD